jgi:hypothetical protein
LDGKFGNFPSLVVEECDENGEPLTEPDDEEDYEDEDGCPPENLPPIIPPSLLPPDDIVVTQPTPMMEQPEFVPPSEPAKKPTDIDLTQKGQKTQVQAPTGKIHVK